MKTTDKTAYARKLHKRRMETDPEYKEQKRLNAEKYRKKIGKAEVNRKAAESHRRLKIERWLATRGWNDKKYLKLQLKGCAICTKQKYSTGKAYLVHDHDHKTGKARGLLCPNCNRMLGWYETREKVINAYINQ